MDQKQLYHFDQRGRTGMDFIIFYFSAPRFCSTWYEKIAIYRVKIQTMIIKYTYLNEIKIHSLEGSTHLLVVKSIRMMSLITGKRYSQTEPVTLNTILTLLKELLLYENSLKSAGSFLATKTRLNILLLTQIWLQAENTNISTINLLSSDKDMTYIPP